MVLIKLDTLEIVNNFVKICDSYKDKMDIDVIHGRYTVDGRSVLAVASLMGNIVKVQPITDDESLMNCFIDDVKKIGGWVQTN